MESQTFSAIVNYNFTNSTYIGTGIGLSSFSTSILYNQNYNPDPDLGATQTDLNASYIVVPVKFGFSWVSTRFRVLTQAGFDFGFYNGHTERTIYENNVADTDYFYHGINPYYINANIGIGVDYTLFDRVRISVLPYYSLPLTDIASTTTRDEFFGVDVGLTMGFGTKKQPKRKIRVRLEQIANY